MKAAYKPGHFFFFYIYSYCVDLRLNFIFLSVYQLILIFHVFHICEFAYLLKCICNFKINTHGTFMVLHRQVLNHLLCTFPAEVKQCKTLPSFFSSTIVNKFPFHGLFGVIFLSILSFLLVISLFKMAQA